MSDTFKPENSCDELIIRVIDQQGITHDLPALNGWSVMEIIRDAGLTGLKAECGGACACATCHVYVDPNWMARLPAKRQEESDLIDDHAINPSLYSRLSCQILIENDLNGLCVTIAPNPE